ncbi:NACHT domain-containing protein [Lentzea sp. BCCO 10_0856]|uniref:NACHT domain-containing protein n=1 Tax=Lentzea miocenica TaxID=3095431 RepID=A0ABU4T330_9PSEU|nr:NACHT domain-containing protein [Lentzea sp. BCCO 10_0856]MDX8032572.1 NACHT domain-containing protein [Lentzea sp. BCCO 10_0856]
MARDDLDFTTGDVTGTVFQANNVHGDVHVHAGKAPRPAYDPPHTWAEAPQWPPEIMWLLLAQVNAAYEAPYRLPGARKPSLDTIYVRQDLGSAVDEPEQPRQGPMLDDDGRLIETPARPVVRFTVRPPSRTLREALNGDAHLVVTGGPGLGKSTLTLRLAADIAQHWMRRLDEDPLAEPVVPLRLTARTLAAHLDVPLAQALADSTVAEYGPLLREPVDKDLFAGRAVGCRWLLLVDGLDEVADADQRHRLVSALAAWASAGAHRILLTTRPTEGGALAPLHRISAVRYELQPFDAAALERFAAKWFPEDDALRFLRQIRDAYLDELVQVPLFATIAAIIFSEYNAQPLPGNQYSLYDTYLAHIRRDQPDRFDREKLLEHLARTRLETDGSLLNAARTWVTDRGVPNSTSWQEELTAYLLSVGPFILRGDDLAFLHHSFAEHLAATSCARDLPDEFCPNAFADVLHAAGPRESGRFARAVLLHHSRLRPTEADRLLDWLHHGDGDQHLLAARLLAHHLPTSADQTEAFLDTVWDWAMTTHYHAADILAEASRATRFAGLTTWLIRLMNCAGAPWGSRAEAATALAVRVRGQHTADAVRLLNHLADEPRASVPDRLMAAEALAQCGIGEREAAERGLRAVLTDPNASASSVRTAAVVLATFGGEAREFAVGTLESKLSNVDSAPLLIAESATGLLEIGPEFADVCAHHFLALLRSPAKTYFTWGDAAFGLASISPAHLEQAVAELTAHVVDGRRTVYEVIAAATALRELGAQHRQAAGELVAAAAEGAVREMDRSLLLGHLVTYGTQRETALAGLRKMLAERHQNWNNIRRVASAIGKVGPSFRDEAAAALLNSGAPPGSHDHVTVLDELVSLGEPYRAQAVRDLRDLLVAPDVHSEVRCRAANTLIRSGPDHHPQAIECLRRLASPSAYQDLARTGVGDEALAALLDCARSPEAADDVMSTLANTVSGQDGARVEEAAAVLRKAARDERRPMRIRITAANGLSVLGSRFDRESAVELRRIIGGEPMISEFFYMASYHSANGPGPRQELADALLEILGDERTSARKAWRAVLALEELGHGGDEAVLAALERLVDFPGLAADDRAEAACLLASRRPAHLDHAANLLVAAAWSFPLELLWSRVGDPRLSDVDLKGRFQAQLIGGRATSGELIAAATVLGDSAMLRRLAQDDLLPLSSRRFAFQNLVSVEPAALGEAAAFLRSVIDDDDVPIDERSRAVWSLTQLDRTTTASAIPVQWRFAEDPSVPMKDRARALRWLWVLLRPTTPRFEQAAVEMLRDPDVSRKVWEWLITTVPRPVRTDLERSMLHNRAIPIEDRVPSADQWDDLPLRNEAVAEIRDVIAAVETPLGELTDAAVALVEVSEAFQPEAVAVLEQLKGPKALSALAGLSETHWWRVHDQALAEAMDEGLPFRVRHAAARLLNDIGAELDAAVTEVLCAAPSWLRRIDDRLVAKDLDTIRKIRDGVDELPVARLRAAWKLGPYSADDRIAGVQLIEDIAVDERERPALRVRAATYLDDFGVVGRRRAACAARAMIAASEFPVLARAEAAMILHQVERSARREALTVLTGLVEQADPLRRVQVLGRIGEFDSMRASMHLQAMGRSELDPVVRMRCARALVEMRRDQREVASVIARAVAWDETVPRHVRRNAARDLARWSELMREDARALLVRLRDCADR